MVIGINLNHRIDAETIRLLKPVLIENGALLIRDQQLTLIQYRQTLGQFGELMEHQNHLKESDGRSAKLDANATWHSEHASQKQPSQYTCLWGVAVPNSGNSTAIATLG